MFDFISKEFQSRNRSFIFNLYAVLGWFKYRKLNIRILLEVSSFIVYGNMWQDSQGVRVRQHNWASDYIDYNNLIMIKFPLRSDCSPRIKAQIYEQIWNILQIIQIIFDFKIVLGLFFIWYESLVFHFIHKKYFIILGITAAY